MTSTQLNSSYIGTSRSDVLRTGNALITIAHIDEMKSNGNITITGNTIVGLDLPTVPTGAATKEYVDLAVGLAWKDPVSYATVPGDADITFGNATTNATGDVDGVAIANAQFTDGMKLLIKNQANAVQNGLYTVVVNGLIKYLERSYDMLVGDTALGAIVYVVSGTLNAGTTWICNATLPCTVGTSNLTFVRYNEVAAGTSNEVQVNLDGNLAAYSTFTYDNSTMTLKIGEEAENSIVRAPDATTTDTDGGSITISAGLKTGAGEHGKVYLETRSAHVTLDGQTSFIYLNSSSSSLQIDGATVTANVGATFTAAAGEDGNPPSPGYTMSFTSAKGGDSTAAAVSGGAGGDVYLTGGDGGEGGATAPAVGGVGGKVVISSGAGGEGNVGAVGGDIEITAADGGDSGDNGVTGPAGGSVKITAGDGGLYDGPGGSVFITSGANQDSGPDGMIYLNTATASFQINGSVITGNVASTVRTADGTSGATPTAGKAITLLSGTGGNDTDVDGDGAAGGQLNITAGDGGDGGANAGGSSGPGGSILITAGSSGAARDTGHGGNVEILTGSVGLADQTGGVSGRVTITTATGGVGTAVTGGASGTIELTTGDGGAGTSGGDAGDIVLTTGDGGAPGGDGGDVRLFAGVKNGGGADGKIYLTSSGIEYNVSGATITSADDIRLVTGAGKAVAVTATNVTGTATGGTIDITAGSVTGGGTGAGGAITITAGSGSTTGKGGNIALVAGLKAGATNDGDIILAQGGKYYKWPTVAPVVGGNRVLTWVTSAATGAVNDPYVLSWA